MAAAGASRKTRAIFRAIYKVATGIARVRGTDGKYVYSSSFKVRRGVIQGDIISPILFILALDQLIQTVDKSGTGVKCRSLFKIRVLGYADDAALAEPTVEKMTERLTKLADASEHEADMKINILKTMSQHVHKRKPIKVTKAEVASAESNYKYQCDLSKEVQDRQTDRCTSIGQMRTQLRHDRRGICGWKIVGVFGYKDAR